MRQTHFLPQAFMETTCRCSLRWSLAEQRLARFGLEMIPGSRSQFENKDGKPETKEDRTKRVDTSYPKDHAEKVKKQYEEDDKRTDKERAEFDIKSTVEMAMSGLEGADPKFKGKFEAALKSLGMGNVTVEVSPGMRNGAVVTLKKESGADMNYTVNFLATNDGTAANMNIVLPQTEQGLKQPQELKNDKTSIDWSQFKAGDVEAGDVLIYRDGEKPSVVRKAGTIYVLSGAGPIREFDSVAGIDAYFKPFGGKTHEVTKEDLKQIEK